MSIKDKYLSNFQYTPQYLWRTKNAHLSDSTI